MRQFITRITMSKVRRNVIELLGYPGDSIVLTIKTLAMTIKDRYPCYGDRSDVALAHAFLAKYPEYAPRIVQ